MNRENELYILSQNIFGSVRKIIALALTIVFCYLSIVGKIDPSEFIPIFSMVLGYYFGKSTALDVPPVNQDSFSINQVKNNIEED
jgi:hypothetical protein